MATEDVGRSGPLDSEGGNAEPGTVVPTILRHSYDAEAFVALVAERRANDEAQASGTPAEPAAATAGMRPAGTS